MRAQLLNTNGERMLGDGGVLVSKFPKNIAAGTNTVQLNVGDIKSGTYLLS